MQQDKPLHIEQQDKDLKGYLELLIFNDPVNTFDHVIRTLIEVCDHIPEQAEQCALIAHSKGKCVVRTGSMETLKPMYHEILRRKINAKVE